MLSNFIIFIFPLITVSKLEINHKLTQIWGPGLRPDDYTVLARYFFIQPYNNDNQPINSNKTLKFEVKFDGHTRNAKSCRIYSQILDRKNGSYIVRYKMHEPCYQMKIHVNYAGEPIAHSPYTVPSTALSDDCICPKPMNQIMEKWNCKMLPPQIQKDMANFDKINWNEIREKLIEKYDKPHSVSLCHYIIKNNQIHRKCYGKYVGFKMFMDNLLGALARKVVLPDLEFFLNLGDWPLVSTINPNKFPIISWCGSNDTYDIVIPTYDIVESTLENMGRVMLDMLSVQGNVQTDWSGRKSKAFWRGRDSNRHRLDLIDIARKHPDLFNVSLTNFFFFRDEEEKYGPKSPYVSFYSFFDYKYQLALDGTVAAYRFPYLLAGGSTVFKQESKYYEHFYDELKPYVHYIPIRQDLTDLVEKIHWAMENDEKSRKIAENGRLYANNHLLPTDILCYHLHLFRELDRRIVNDVKVFDDMEMYVTDLQPNYCDCMNGKDEL